MKNNNPRLVKLMEKAKSYCRSKDYKKAINCYYVVLKIDPKYKYALYYMGKAYNNLTEY